MPVRRLALTATLAATAAFMSGCSDDDAEEAAIRVSTGEAFPAERCERNRAAGTIVYRSGYDFAASASIVDVLVAEQKGYFDALCLDVVVQASDAAQNYAVVASNEAQFASGGSFNEVVGYEREHADADLVVVVVEGKQPNGALVVREGGATSLAELRGATIGVKGQLPAGVSALLAKAGLVEGRDFTTKALEGYDPLEHIADGEVVGFPVYKSNEPGQLDRAGIPYLLFDPVAEGIPGSFGVIYTSAAFLEEHPTAAEDFVRAAMRGLADAVSDPAAASMIALDFIVNNGNAAGLSTDTEAFRWQTESALVVDSTGQDEPLGLPDRERLEAEVEAYADFGLYDGEAPDVSELIDDSVVSAVYDNTHAVIWPAT